MSRLGLITVGQAPRVDITPYMGKLLGAGVDLVEKGALDGMDGSQLTAMAPVGSESILASRLKDGSEIIISHDKVIPLIQEKINELNEDGIDLILLLCTGHFPCFNSNALVLESQRIVDNVLKAILKKDSTLGLFIPHPEQANASAAKLCHVTPTVVTASASPYCSTVGEEKDQFTKAAKSMISLNPDLIVLHCMGYNQTHKQLLAEMLHVPIVVANSIVARTVAELLPG